MRTHTVIGFGEQTRYTPVTERSDASVHCCDCCERIATGSLGGVGSGGERGPNPTVANGVDTGATATPPPCPSTPASDTTLVRDAVVVYIISLRPSIWHYMMYLK